MLNAELLHIRGRMTMSSLRIEGHLQDPYYVHWLEVGTCLRFLKPFLESLATELSISLHKSVMKNILVCRQNQNNPSYMTMCKNSIISFKRTMNKWTINCCANCQCYINQLVKCCDQPFKLKKGNWASSKIELWPTDPWEKSKVYLGTNQTKFKVQNTPQDTDFSDLVNFIDHCHVPGSDLRPSGIFKLKVTKIRECRHAVMHSTTFKITDQEFNKHTDAILDFLRDYLLHPALKQAALDAYQQIQEVKNARFVITTDAEYLVLKARSEALQEQTIEICQEIGTLQKQCTSLKGKHGKKTKDAFKQVSSKIQEKEQNLDMLDISFASLVSLTNENQQLQTKMNDTIASTSAILNKVKSHLEELKREQLVVARTSSSFELIMEDCIGKDDQIAKLKEENATLKRMNESERIMAVKTKDLQLELDAVRRDLETEKAEKCTLRNEVDELRTELRVLNEDHSRLLNMRKENEKLLLILGDHEEVIKGLSSVQKDNEQLKRQNKCLELDNVTIGSDYRERIHELNALRTKHNEMLLQLERTKGEVDNIRKEINNVIQSLNGVAKRHDVIIQQNETLKNEFFSLNGENSQYCGKETEILKERNNNQTDSQKLKSAISASAEELQNVCEMNNNFELEKSVLLQQFHALQTEHVATLKSVKWKLNSFKQHVDHDIEKINEIEMKQMQRNAACNLIV